MDDDEYIPLDDSFEAALQRESPAAYKTILENTEDMMVDVYWEGDPPNDRLLCGKCCLVVHNEVGHKQWHRDLTLAFKIPLYAFEELTKIVQEAVGG